jgi:hypothetical protein
VREHTWFCSCISPLATHTFRLSSISTRSLCSGGPPLILDGGVGRVRFPGKRVKDLRHVVDATLPVKESRLMVLTTGQNRQVQFPCYSRIYCVTDKLGLLLRNCCLVYATEQCLRVAKNRVYNGLKPRCSAWQNGSGPIESGGRQGLGLECALNRKPCTNCICVSFFTRCKYVHLRNSP